MREWYFSLWIPHLKMMIIGWVNSFKLILPFWILILLLISWMIWTSYLSVLRLSFLNWKMEMKPALPLELVWSLKVIMWGYTQFMKASHCPTYRRSRINWCQHLAAAKKTVLLRNTCLSKNKDDSKYEYWTLSKYSNTSYVGICFSLLFSC